MRTCLMLWVMRRKWLPPPLASTGPPPQLGLPEWLVVKRICLTTQELQEIGFRSLGWEDPLEEEIATYSSILAWEIPWTEVPGRL